MQDWLCDHGNPLRPWYLVGGASSARLRLETYSAKALRLRDLGSFGFGLPYARFLQLRARRRAVEEFFEKLCEPGMFQLGPDFALQSFPYGGV